MDDQQQQPLRGESDAGLSGLSVSQAAATLGLSVNATRHRIRRGSLAASKVDGEWRVFVDVPADSPDAARPASPLDSSRGQWPRPTPDRPAADSPLASATDAGATQLAILRDTLLAPLIALTERQQATIAEVEHANGRLEAERDALRERVAALEAQQAAAPAAPPTEAQPSPRRRWWAFWEP